MKKSSIVFMVLIGMMIGKSAFARDPALATLEPSRVKLTILDSETLLKINNSIKDRHFINLQQGKLVTAETAVEGAGPVCMFGLGPKSSQNINNGTALQVTKIQQGSNMPGLVSLVILTDGDYMIDCEMNDVSYIYQVDELNQTLGGVLRVDVLK